MIVEPPPLVTIGLLTYNNESTLKPALDGLVNQDYPHKEIVIFDDCSTDQTFEMCEDYARQFPFIKLFRNETNLGCFENLKRLLSHVKGDYFLWACPDDIYERQFLPQTVSLLEEKPDLAAACCYTRVVYTNDAGEVISERTELFEQLRWGELSYERGRARHIENLIKCRPYSYVLVIHELLRSHHIHLLRANPFFFSIEEYFPLFLVYLGGIGITKEILYTKYQSLVPLRIRNPAAAKLYGTFYSLVLSAFFALKQAFKLALPQAKKWELYFFIIKAAKFRLFCFLYQKYAPSWIGRTYRRMKALVSKIL